MFETIVWNRAQNADLRRRSNAGPRPGFFVKRLTAGQILFEPSEPKECIFRVEDGAIRILARGPEKSAETIEEIARGVVFGLGNLDHHIHTAMAIVESTVSF